MHFLKSHKKTFLFELRYTVFFFCVDISTEYRQMLNLSRDMKREQWSPEDISFGGGYFKLPGKVLRFIHNALSYSKQ